MTGPCEKGPSSGVDAAFSDVQVLGECTGITLGIERPELVTHVEYGVLHDDGEYEAVSDQNLMSLRPARYRAEEITWAHGGTVVQRVITVGDWTEVQS